MSRPAPEGPCSEPAASAARPLQVLFVCTRNAGRSQMAEALLAAWGGTDFVVASAGTLPSRVSPYTVRVLAELGIDWRAARSKPVAALLGQPFDVVVTVCDRAREACPVVPGAHETLHWRIDDQADADGRPAARLAAYRDARDAIGARLRAFIAQRRASMRPPAGGSPAAAG